MNQPILQLIAFFILANPFLSVLALEENAVPFEQPHSELYFQVSEYLKQKSDQKIFEPEFELKKLSTNVTLPKCQTELILKDRNPTTYAGRITLSLSCEQPTWRIFIPVTISGKLPVVVSTKGILKQAVIKEGDVVKTLVPYQKAPKGHLIDIKTAIGMRAKKAISPNKILKITDLQPAFWVFKNQQVTLITRIGNIEVKAKGTALKNGVESEQVPVKNASSKKTLKGIVIAPNTVFIP